MRPGHSVRPKIRLTESGIDLITILRCFLSFKTVVMSRNIIVFKIKFSRPKKGHPSRARSLVPRAASCPLPTPARPPRQRAAAGPYAEGHRTGQRGGEGRACRAAGHPPARRAGRGAGGAPRVAPTPASNPCRLPTEAAGGRQRLPAGRRGGDAQRRLAARRPPPTEDCACTAPSVHETLRPHPQR